jgi:putative component of toxin-antitoxin plasmid stabilization module
VFEYRIDFGPGYRNYLAKDGEALVICLAAVQSGGNSRQFPLDFVLKKSIDEPLMLD